jgi:flagellin-like hook-associated protein FlgL
MASNITLSAGVRQNLLSLQSTAELMALTQNRLATGKKVNSALDNPLNFFTSQSLSNRASDLNALLDSIGQAQQTLKAADTGISSLTKLVESAKSIAKQATQAASPASTYALAITGNAAIAADTAAVVTGTAAIAADSAADLTGTVGSLATTTTLDTLGLTTGETISIGDGTNTVTYTVGATPASEDIDDVITTLNGGAATWTVSIQGGSLNVVSDNNTDTLTIGGTGAADAWGTTTTGGPTNSAVAALTGILTVTQGAGTPVTVDFGTVTTRAGILSALGGIGTFDGSNHLVLTASNTTDSLAVSGTLTSQTGLGLANSADPANTTLGSLSGTLTVQVGSATAQTITFGSGANVGNRAELVTALSALTGVTATIDSSNFISITSTTSDAVTIGGTDAATFFAAANIGANTPTATVGAPSTTRANLQAQYNDVLTQITALAGDASYNGVNLLNGDNLKVVFNENGSSSQTISGVTYSATGLGLTALSATEFQSNASIDTIVGNLDTALSTLRTQASKFGSNLTTVQTRQDFTKNLITTLQTGADNLVLADTNEEGANLLALQTRQQLSTTALSLSAQADQAVLRLFG